ncbi:MAG: phosphodiester glycosidase family protein [Eubacteriales bacterium]|nr:phosphodiester glycosidase family protein [Eubacteriales bacterium]
MKVFLMIVRRVLIFIITTLILLFILLFLSLKLICSNISPSAKELFTTTILETGQVKFLASWFLSKEEILAIVNKNTISEMNIEMDQSMIDAHAKKEKNNDKGYRIEKISGTTFMAKMLIVDDPSRVQVSTTYPWQEYGKELSEICIEASASCAINGGLYFSHMNTGGHPLGVVVSNGQIQYNEPLGVVGIHLIGFDENDVLRIINIEGYNKNDVIKLVEEEKIRDAVVFQEERSDINNHFVKLIINGEEREFDGLGSGANPRTAIGQRADGTVLLLVTDGRGRDGHLGATIKDLIKIMKEYGAVNAANIDGGSSSSMFVDGTYEMTSVTLYNSNSSWKLPAAITVK